MESIMNTNTDENRFRLTRFINVTEKIFSINILTVKGIWTESKTDANPDMNRLIFTKEEVII